MDKKAKNILFKTYWKSGWIDSKDRKTENEDFVYAKSKGLMFEPFNISHDEAIKEILKIIPSISKEKVVKAFLSSLSTNRLDWRSSLASYFIAKQIIDHKFTKVISGQSFDQNGNITHTSYTCEICRDLKYGIIGDLNYNNIDLNVLNFERIKWGGVRQSNLDYTIFDLKQLQIAEITEPTIEDVNIFKLILETIEKSEPNDYPGKLEKNLSNVIKSTKNERIILIEILACIEVLKPKSYDRKTTNKNDWKFVEYWRGEDKYNKETVDEYFKRYIK
jgi:hypothetical protein